MPTPMPTPMPMPMPTPTPTPTPTTNIQNPYKDSKFNYEFGGPIGAFLTILSLPPLILTLTYFASIGQVNTNLHDIYSNCFSIQNYNNYNNLTTLLYCTCVLLSWFGFQVLLERFLPCDVVQGVTLENGQRLKYKLNGHLAFWTTVSILLMGYPAISYDNGNGNGNDYEYDEDQQQRILKIYFQSFPLQLLYDYYADLALSSIVLCTILSIYLYIKSFCSNALLAKGGNSGVAIYDFYMGRELNPRSMNNTFDWKEFCELRPGLIGWAVLNAAFASKQYDKLGYMTGSMLFVNVFQGLYVWDALYQERAILTTMDITSDGFGFMLVFGDLSWVPFLYSLQARYLVDYDPHLGPWALAGILLVNFLGYSIFRGANSQKDAFRRNPNDDSVAHLQYLQTKRGTRLLTSGYWGMARKINYTGDWIMALSWCLLCGFESIVPYFYAIYFCILLIHRSERDDHMCHEKYGDDWIKYKQLVPYRFIPGIV